MGFLLSLCYYILSLFQFRVTILTTNLHLPDYICTLLGFHHRSLSVVIKLYHHPLFSYKSHAPSYKSKMSFSTNKPKAS